jgi:PAS domain S-box-containing protein
MHRISEDRRVFKFFTAMYAVALTTLAVLSIVSQIGIQQALSHQMHDSHVINFAARLRTYSQTLSKLALLLESGQDVETNRKEFTNTLMQWQKSHEGLQSGSNFLNLPANDQDELKQMFDIIRTPHQEIWKAASKMSEILSNDKPLDTSAIHPYVQTILAYEKSYLLGMELIVFDYDRFSKERVRKLKQVEFIMLTLVLTTLLIEAAVIFYPLSMRIRKVIKGLIASEETSKQLADQLQEANKLMEQSHNELREVTYALDKATYLVKTDQDGHIIYANDKYCHVTRYSMSELRGKPLFHHYDSTVFAHLNDPARRMEVWQGEIFDHASDGTGFWLDVTMIPVFDNTGRLYQYMVICSDITKRKNTEREIRQLTEEKLRRQDMEQKIRSYAIISGQEKERKRVAAEIHDGIGQMLTSLRMKMEQVEDKLVAPDPEITRVNGLLYSIITETKRICSDLLPSVLEDFGLRAAIEELIKSCRESARNIAFRLEECQLSQPLAREVEIGIYRILQEALNNAIKHSQATEIDVHIDREEGYLNLMIHDNGKGFYFDNQQFFSREQVRKVNGLRNMKERAELLGGTLSITSQPGKGTIIHLEITF